MKGSDPRLVLGVLGAVVLMLAGCRAGMRVGSGSTDQGGRTMRVSEGEVQRGGGPGVLDRSTPPAVGDPPSLDLPDVKRFSLASGLDVVLVERPGLPLVNVELLVRGGARGQGGRPGLAGFTLDLLDEGTASRSALDIATLAEGMGAELSTGASWDHTWVSLNVLSAHLAGGLELMGDVVLRPAFRDKDLERVRQERLARILQEQDEPRVAADDLFARVLFGEGHPYGEPLLGTAAALSALTRDHVVDYYRGTFREANATLLVVGQVEQDTLTLLLEEAFRAWPPGDAPGTPSVLDQPALPPASADAVTIHLADRPGAPQSEIRVGWVAMARGGPDEHVVTVLNTILGGSFTSRLMQNLREDKGFTYGAGSSFARRRAPGPFVARSAVHTPTTGQAVLEVLHEIRRMRDEVVPPDELARARRYVALRLPQRFEALEDVTARLAEQILHDLPPDYWETYVPGLLSVTAEQIQQAAREHIPATGLTVVVVGDRSALEEPLRGLGLGPVIIHPREVRP